LGFEAAAMVHEAALVYSPPAERLLCALNAAIPCDSMTDTTGQWRLVSEHEKTLEELDRIGAAALHWHDVQDGSFQLYGSKRRRVDISGERFIKDPQIGDD
jgi:fructose-1,6-bisphosphatase/inositol monophosphatase family enzyme